MATRSRLGRGLGSLLSSTKESAPDTPTTSDTAPPPSAGDGLTAVAIDKIDVNPHQPRRTFDPVSLESLADSIKANGVIQPVIVRPKADGRFELIAGERRFRAAGLAKLIDLPVVVRDIDGYTQAQWAIVENIHREDLNPIDRAEAYAALLTQLGLSQAELAGRLGEQRSSIANYLRLLDLDPTIREDLRDGTLSLGHAKVLAGVTPAWEQLRLARLVRDQNLSVRNLERIVECLPKDGIPSGESAAPASPNLHLHEVEEQFVQQLGLRVQLRGGKKAGTGRVVIHYRSLEEFDELMRRCGIVLAAE